MWAEKTVVSVKNLKKSLKKFWNNTIRKYLHITQHKTVFRNEGKKCINIWIDIISKKFR